MQFTAFSLLFLIIVLVLFYSLRVEFRLYILTVASVVYPFFLSKVAGIVVLIFSSLVYLEGLLLDKCKKSILVRRILFVVFVGGISIILVAGKDFSAFINVIYNNVDESYKIIIPIGFSFYTFQAISYLVDIYSFKIQPMKNPFYFHLYMSWFPKFVSGPIEKADTFFKKLSSISSVKILTFNRLKRAFIYILLGCFYKIVIADRLVVPVMQAFSAPQMYSGCILLLVAIMYSIRIYCDFAGYSMFVIGISELFGIELVENFNTPYLTTNIKDFWDRWHISLSKWLQEYIYIPLGGNRRGDKRKYFNIMCVFVISGIWHGAGLKFVIWGGLHGIYSIFDCFLEKRKCLKFREGGLGRIVLIIEVIFAWIFFAANSVTDAINYIVLMITNRSKASLIAQLASAGIYTNKVGTLVFILLLVVLVIAELFFYKVGLRKLVDNLSVPKFLFLVWILFFTIIVLGIYGPDTGVKEMIYMNF